MEEILLNRFMVDNNKCTGCKACVDAYSNIFEMDEKNNIAYAYSPALASKYPEADVISVCPGSAIKLEVKYTGSSQDIVIKDKKEEKEITSRFGNTMGKEILVLMKMLMDKEEYHPGKIGQIQEKAILMLEEIDEIMQKKDYTIDELEKKDITLRQRYERANILLTNIAKFKQKMGLRVPTDSYKYFVNEKKRSSILSNNNN